MKFTEFQPAQSIKFYTTFCCHGLTHKRDLLQDSIYVHTIEIRTNYRNTFIVSRNRLQL